MDLIEIIGYELFATLYLYLSQRIYVINGKFFVTQMNNLTYQQRTISYQMNHRMFIFICGFYSIRFIYITMSHYNPMRYQLWKYETFVELANSLRYKNDPFSMTIFVYLFTFCMTIESMIYLRPQHTYSWDMFNDYVIYNYQLYCESIRSKVETRRLIKLIHHKQLQLLQYKYSRFIPNMILNMMAWFRTQGIAKRKHLNVDLERFHSKPLRMFPSMSLQLRLKYVDLYRYVEMVSSIAIIFICKYSYLERFEYL